MPVISPMDWSSGVEGVFRRWISPLCSSSSSKSVKVPPTSIPSLALILPSSRARRRTLVYHPPDPHEPACGVAAAVPPHLIHDMAEKQARRRGARFWIVLVGIVILLIFLYFYQPFQDYLSTAIPNVHFSNVLFWFASLVGVVAYAVAHWQSFRQNIFKAATELDVEGLVYDTLQIAILVAVVFAAGATLQAVEMLGEHLVAGGPVIDPSFGRRLLSIVLLVILAILFYLLHQLVRAFRRGWRPRKPPPRGA